MHIVEKVEDHYWDADGLNEELLKQFIIEIGVMIVMTTSVMVVEMLTPWKRAIRLKMYVLITLVLF